MKSKNLDKLLDMADGDSRERLGRIVALANDYCVTVQRAIDFDRDEFVAAMTNYLPRLYWEFADLEAEDAEADDYLMNYIDEDYYESVRRNMESVLAERDTYLETFEEDMKYSDTPIGASISEGLADIFQDLYSFVMRVRESEGNDLTTAYSACRDAFKAYWAQVLCNVMRPLNNIRFDNE